MKTNVQEDSFVTEKMSVIQNAERNGEPATRTIQHVKTLLIQHA